MLVKWHVEENMQIDTYALVCEVETSSLTDDVRCKDVYRLDVEIQQDCYIAKILCREGDLIQAGFPIAICCDDEEEVEIVKQWQDGVFDSQKDAYKLGSAFSLAGFQSYTKSILKNKSPGLNPHSHS